MLKKELEKFREIQDHLRAENPNGGFVVIKGREVLGVWNDRMDALKQGVEKYGNVSFLVKDITEDINDVTHVINLSRDVKFE